MSSDQDPLSSKRAKSDLLVSTTKDNVKVGSGGVPMRKSPARQSDVKATQKKEPSWFQIATESSLPAPPLDKHEGEPAEQSHAPTSPDDKKGFTSAWLDSMTPAELKAFDDWVYGPGGAPDIAPFYDNGEDIDYEHGWLY